MTQRTCGASGCAKLHRARGLCATHYNRQYQPNERHRKVLTPCSWCGTGCLKAATKRYEQRFCSLHCRDTWRRRDRLPVLYIGTEALSVVEPWTPRIRKARAKLAKALTCERGGTWVGGRCARCGTHFVSLMRNDLGRYCSKACKRRASGSRRRAVERSAVHVPYARHKIFERDGWRCHLCRRKTDRSKAVPHAKAPTIDHLIPLVEGGDDTAANVATACFLCNSTKGERGGGEQLALL